MAQSADEAALRQLVERFFTAYQNRDLDALLPLWSDKSANLAAAKASFQRTFDANKLAVKSLTFRKIRVEDGKASVRVVAEIDAVDAKTGGGASGFGKVNRTLDTRVLVEDATIRRLFTSVVLEPAPLPPPLQAPRKRGG